MKSTLIILCFALATCLAFPADDKAAPAVDKAPEADAGKPSSVAESKGCAMLVGKDAKPMPVGSQVCWRHPEYLTCDNSGNWFPKFCPAGQKCQESGGKVSCVDYQQQPQNTDVAPAAPETNEVKAEPARQ